MICPQYSATSPDRHVHFFRRIPRRVPYSYIPDDGVMKFRWMYCVATMNAELPGRGPVMAPHKSRPLEYEPRRIRGDPRCRAPHISVSKKKSLSRIITCQVLKFRHKLWTTRRRSALLVYDITYTSERFMTFVAQWIGEIFVDLVLFLLHFCSDCQSYWTCR